MPLSVNVGLSRKASKDYQSTGCSINVTAELDQSLLARPEELQQQIAALYGQAEAALDRQAGQGHPPAGLQPPHLADLPCGRRAQSRSRPATTAQRRAIQAICRRRGTDAGVEVRQMMGTSLAELSLKQASELIDSLESAPPARPGGGVP